MSYETVGEGVGAGRRLARLLSLLTSEASADGTPLNRLSAARVRELLPSAGGPTHFQASSLQRRLWFLEQLHPQTGAYHVPLAVRLQGPLDRTALARALDAATWRHEILRTTLEDSGGQPVQVVRQAIDVALDVRQVEGPREPVSRYLDTIAELIREPFDMARIPPWRAVLLKASALDHCLVLIFHHTIVDGWSLDVLLDELSRAYESPDAADGHPPAQDLVQYAEFAAWEHVRDAAGLLDDDVEYWTRHLAAAPAGIDLDGDRTHAASEVFAGGVLRRELDPDVSARLADLAAVAGATTFTIGLAAWAAWLRARSGESDIIVATPSAGRTRPALESMLGPTVNTLALRLDVGASATFRDLIHQATAVSRAGRAHQHAPIERVLERVRPVRSHTRAPFAQVAFAREIEPRPLALPGLVCTRLTVDHPAVKTDLALSLSRVDERWGLGLEYSSDLFSERAARVALDDFASFVASAAATPTVAWRATPERRPRLPLTPVQTRVWLDQQRSPEAPLYNVGIAVSIDGTVDRAAFGRAFARLVRGADALRLGFGTANGAPFQRVRDDIDGHVEQVDLTGASAERLDAWLREESSRRFDLGGPLFRSTLAQTGPDRCVWLLVQHHLLTDGWSTRLLLERMSSLYDEEFAGGAVPVSHASFADYVRDRAAAKDEDAWWLERFREVEPPRFGASARVRRSTQQTRTRVEFDPALRDAFHELGARVGRASPAQAAFIVSGAALVATLHRMTGQQLIGVGVPVHNRRGARDRDIVGLLMNVVPIAVGCAADDMFEALFARVGTELRGTLRRGGSLPPESVRERACDVLLNVQATDLDRYCGHPARIEWVDAGHERESLTILFHDLSDGRIGFDLQTHDEVFDEDARASMAAGLLAMIRACVDNPAARIGEVRLLDEVRHERATSLSRGLAVPGAYAEPVIARILRTARARPNGVALRMAGADRGPVSYAELEDRVRRVAGGLIARGVVAGDLVGVRLERGAEFVYAILGVLASGAAYLPLDPRWPDARVRAIAADAAPRCTIFPAGAPARLPAGTGTARDAGGTASDVVGIDTLLASDAAATLPDRHADDLAYVIYTSGSTGVPKGVEVVDRGLANYSAYASATFALAPADRALQFAALTFDTAVEEIFPTLESGATLVLRDDAMIESPARFVRRLAELEITVLNLPTSYWHAIVDAGVAPPPCVRLVLVGGDAMRADALRQWHARTDPRRVRVLNGYGPTETTVVATFADVAGDVADGSVSIGTPIWNVEASVRDSSGALAGDGQPGELFIGGAGLARGYRNDPALTAARFIDHPDRPGERLYRTGDLVKRRADGSLAFLGRLDDQVKVRGYRVQLEEIEIALRGHRAVADVAVVVDGDEEGSARLAAYVVASGGHDLDVVELRAHLRTSLPDYMMPAAMYGLPSLPRVSNGKVDKAALSAGAVPIGSRTTGLLPRTDTERRVAEVWSAVLGGQAPGVHDNFFDAGGHSLVATRLAARLSEAFAVDLPLRDIFERPTVAGLAEAIADRVGSADPLSQAVRGATVSDALDGGGDAADPDSAAPLSAPASLAQQRLWLAADADPTGAAYNLSRAIEVAGRIDLVALQQAVEAVVARHDALRTSFARVDGALLQIVSPTDTIRVEMSHLSTSGEVDEAVRLEAERPFDLSQGRLCRIRVFRLDDRDVLSLALHHIICDGWSFSILSRDLASAYDAFASGRTPNLGAPPVPYAVATARQQRADAPGREAAIDYWRRTLADGPSRLPLPVDFVRPDHSSGRGGRVTLPLAASVPAAVARLAREERTTPFVVLLSAFAGFLHRWTGSADIPIGTPVAGRSDPDARDVVGLFVNTVVPRFHAREGWTLRDATAAGRSIVLDALRHQAAPFEAVVGAMQPPRIAGESPIFQVMFALQENDDEAVRLGGSPTRAVEVHTGTAKFDLTAFAFDRAGRLELAFEFNRDLFRETTIAAALRAFALLLESALASADAPLDAAPWLTDTERGNLLALAAGETRPYPPTIVEAWARGSTRRDAVALEDRGVSMSYGELDARAGSMARALDAHGVRQGDRVAVIAPRGASLVVAMLGILRAGAAYVPIDTSYPADRVRLMIDDADARVVLRLGTIAVDAGSRPVLDMAAMAMDNDAAEAAPTPSPAAAPPVVGASPAYVMYTSGSTGVPKGVVVPHQAITRLVVNTDYCQIEPADRVAQASTASFDAATFEIWGALLNGATLVFVPPDVVSSPALLAGRLRDDRITVLFLTTAVFNRVARECPDAFDRLRALLCGGETADPAAVQRVVERGLPLLLHVYGPTESTTFATAYPIRALEPNAPNVPIGRPIANTSAYVLDRRLGPVPTGVTGELFLGGDGLALGYHEHRELTAAAFIDNPFGGGRLYRSGDRCRMRHDGQIEFLGRGDRQVKLRGFRIEPAEIERALASHPSVSGAVVDVVAAGDDSRLAAWVTVSDPTVSAAALRTYLGARIPAFLVPSAIGVVEALPVTSNGKIDRRRLPAIVETREDGRVPRAPRDPLEAELVRIWEEILQVSPIGTNDNFFELGGHSLLAAAMIDRVEALFGRRVPISALMHDATIDALATAYWQAETSRGTPLVPIQEHGDRPPLFFMHGDLNGGGLYCSRIARQLDPSQPFYALAPSGFSSADTGLSIQSMAEEYAAIIRRTRPEGPIAVGGYCHGALVAFETARLLARDRVVTNVLMVHPSPVEPRLLPVDRVLRGIGRVRRTGNSTHTRVMVRVVTALAFLRRARSSEIARWALNKARRITAGAPLRALPAAVVQPSGRRHDAVQWDAVVTAVIAYVPRPYGGAVSLLVPEGNVQQGRGWDRFANRVAVVPIPGNHDSAVTTYVDTLGAVCERLLEETLPVPVDDDQSARLTIRSPRA